MVLSKQSFGMLLNTVILVNCATWSRYYQISIQAKCCSKESVKDISFITADTSEMVSYVYCFVS